MFNQTPNPNYPRQNPYVDSQSTVLSEKLIHTSATKAYGEMTIGLFVTAVVACLSYLTGFTYDLLVTAGNIGWIILSIIQIALAVFLSARIFRMRVSSARFCFYLYAVLMGLTLSTIFFEFSATDISLSLFMTAGFFLCLTMIGLTTKKNILNARMIFVVGFIVLIVAELLLMLIHSSALVMLVTAISLVLFAGLTIYDAQWTRQLFNQYGNNPDMLNRISILAALNLYLDFINLFLSVLQLFNNSRR
ncbi:MAG: Bax inhibitor-1/YccA family protein [Aeriscardovia sp.]|nr:Bax inhibitor-1/YccA family protein [Aeriscardovia sp.]